MREMNEKMFDLEIKKVSESPIKEKKNNINELNLINNTTNQYNEIIDLKIKQDCNVLKPLIDKKNKCSFADCSKKLTLVELNLKCKCGNCYCGNHRHFNNHKCQFDYIKLNKDNLGKVLNKVECEKIQKI